ncbi:MAG: ABC transporter substrate-binding protein [Acetanaerobacterium sp.]
MKRITRFIALIVAIVLCTLCAACGFLGDGPQNTVAGDEPLSGSLASTGLCVFTLFEDAQYRAIADRFAAQNPDVVIDDHSQGYSDSTQNDLAALFEGATPPDVVFFHTGENAAEFVKDRRFVPLDEIRQEYSGYAQDILPEAIEGANGKGKTAYAVPVRGFYEGLFVNTDLFEEYDLALPDSWKALLKAIKVFGETDIVPVAVSLSDTPHYLLDHLILAQGGAAGFGAVPASVGEVPESWYDAMDVLAQLYEAGAFGADSDTRSDADATALFLEKKAAMRLDGSWLAARIVDEGDGETTVVMALPKTPGGKKRNSELIGGFTSGFYITRSAWSNERRRAAAVAFVDAMTGAESVRSLCGVGDLPAVKSAAAQGDGALAQSVQKLCAGVPVVTMPADARLDADMWRYVTRSAVAVAAGEADAREIFAGAFS